MTYQEAFDFAQSNALAGRIQNAMHEWVLNLQSLENDAPLRAAKIGFALQIIGARTTWAERLGWFVAASIRKNQLPAECTDEQLQACVSGLIDLFVAANNPQQVEQA
jgi:hypothetical protein